MSFYKYPAAGGAASANASVGLNGASAPASSTEIAGKSPSGKLVPVAVDESGNQTPNLSTGAATSAKQDAQTTLLTSIASEVNGVATASNQATEIAALAHIASNSDSAATSAKQDTGNASLATIASEVSGVSTAANQATEITALQAIQSQTNGVATAANQVLEIAQLTAINTNTAAGSTAANQASEIAQLTAIGANTASNIQATGTISANGSSVTLLFGSAAVATGTLSVTGTFVATASIQLLEPDGATWVNTSYYPNFSGGNSSSITAAALGSLPVYGYRGIRVLTSAYTSGTMNVSLGGTSAVVFTKAIQDTSGNLQTAATLLASAAAIGSVNLVSNTSIADVSSAVITATTTSGSFTPSYGSSYMINIPVTAVSGTSPTMLIQVQESADGGTNWYTTYTFPVITAIGSYNSPTITLTGNRVRYVQTITGTSPSFTRAVSRLVSNQPNYAVPSGTTFVDRSGSTSATANTSTQVAAYNQTRRYFFFQNFGTSPVYLNFTSAASNAAGSVYIGPFGSWVAENSTITTEAIYVASATASIPYTAKEG